MRIAVWLTSHDSESLNFAPGHARRLERELPGAEVVRCADEAEFLAALPAAELALVWVFRQEWFPLAPRLRWLATPAAGREWTLVEPPPGVRQLYGSYHGRIMGETALALLLGACRGVFWTMTQPDPWPRLELSRRARLLHGAHLAILGFGHIGEHIGRLAKPFGCRLTGIKRQPSPAPAWFAPGDRLATFAELDALLPSVDHLLLCLPLSPATDKLLDRRRLALLPPQAWVYNLGRGNAIDEAALAEALAAGRLAGAALDVFQDEPLPADSPLRRLPNCVLLPHGSAFAPEYMDFFLDELLPQLRREPAAAAVSKGTIP